MNSWELYLLVYRLSWPEAILSDKDPSSLYKEPGLSLLQDVQVYATSRHMLWDYCLLAQA